MPTPTTPDRRGDPCVVLRPDRRLIRAGSRSRRFLVIDVTAPSTTPDPARRRAPVNLAFVLDRSGSMSGHQKLALAKQAVLESIHRLDPEDRFAVVTYDDQVDVVMPATRASAGARGDAARRLRTVEPRSTTDLHAGWLTGCEQVASGLVEAGVNRVLLLTDGLANRGIVAPNRLAAEAYELRRRGVATSTFGVGTDFDEALLQAMADNGGGHFYYASDVVAMRDHITSEVGETLEVVAREVVLELRLPDAVRVESLSPFRLEQRPGQARVYLGDMVSGQVLTIALRLTFDYGDVGREVGAVIRVEDRDGAFAGAMSGSATASVAWRYGDHEANDRQMRDVEVDRIVARLFTERARQDAVRLNREGRYEDARRVLEEVRQHVARYARDDAVLGALVEELDAAQPAFAAPMAESLRKEVHFLAGNVSRMRSVDGRSLRR